MSRGQQLNCSIAAIQKTVIVILTAFVVVCDLFLFFIHHHSLSLLSINSAYFGQ